MSQNREVQDRVGVVKGLNTRGAGDDLEMAQFISRQITPSSWYLSAEWPCVPESVGPSRGLVRHGDMSAFGG